MDLMQSFVNIISFVIIKKALAIRVILSHAVDKTYAAIINGVPESNLCKPLASHEAERLDTQIDDDDNNHAWNKIATELDNKPCITLWRAMQTSKSNNIARNSTFIKIEIFRAVTRLRLE